jgi:hypothetical protein
MALVAGCANDDGSRHAFAPSLAARPATVWVVGDGTAKRRGRTVAALIARGKPDLLVYLGDVYKHGTAANFARNYASSYGRFARITAPTPGNHDWPNHVSGYDRYWRRARGAPAPPWYTFTAAGWQFISLNSQVKHGRASPQFRWLVAELRGAGTCRIAFWHRPRFSAGIEHGDQRDMTDVWDALRGHVALVLNGHEHDMQRLAPIDGITELIVGTGGAPLHPVRRHDPRVVFAQDTQWGALRMQLRPGFASYAFIGADGQVLNKGRVGCRPLTRP